MLAPGDRTEVIGAHIPDKRPPATYLQIGLTPPPKNSFHIGDRSSIVPTLLVLPGSRALRSIRT